MTLAVIFDVGRVLFRWDLRYLFDRLIADEDERDWFLANVVTPEWHYQHDAGRPLDPMLAERIARFPDQADRIRAYRSHFLESIPGPVAGMPELVERLHAAGTPLFIITNFGAEFWQMFRPTQELFDRFTGILVSGQERLLKPDPAIFRLALDRFGLAAADSLFIDDIAENVASAAGVGLESHQFVDAPTATAWLRARGLAV